MLSSSSGKDFSMCFLETFARGSYNKRFWVGQAFINCRFLIADWGIKLYRNFLFGHGFTLLDVYYLTG